MTRAMLHFKKYNFKHTKHNDLQKIKNSELENEFNKRNIIKEGKCSPVMEHFYTFYKRRSPHWKSCLFYKIRRL